MLNAKRIYTSLKGCASLTRTLLVTTDRRHWSRVAGGGVPPWDARNEIIAGMIPGGSSVVDLGCGARTLRGHLKPGCVYRPFDVVPSDASVGHCDFNAGIYPRLAAPVDYVVCSGVLEYIWNPAGFLQRIARLGRTICLSYNPRLPQESRHSRLAKKWVNHLAEDELRRLFAEARLAVRAVRRRPPTEVIFQLESLTWRF